MARPSKEQIETEIAALIKIKPTVLRRSAFGDDHHDAIDAQVKVLRDDMDEDDTYDEFDGGPDNVLSAAREAADWLSGDSDDLPSEGWKSLVR